MFIGMSQRYVPSINYGSRAKTRSRRMELLKYAGRDIVLHYRSGKTERLKVYGYDGPYLILLAPSSSLGHIAIEVDKWELREENGVLHAYPNGAQPNQRPGGEGVQAASASQASAGAQ